MNENRKIYSVAELNRAARLTLENGIGEVWVEGEISRLTQHASGHWYFTLKDEAAAVSCAMFKQNNAMVLFHPKDGIKIRVLGQASLYEARGNYQLIVHKMEEAGKGDLQEQFEKLKAKLAAEGLFDEDRKKPLPMLPHKIGVVTSPTGAAVRDIINVLTRRFPNIGILLAPVTVQGPTAAKSIAKAIRYLNERNRNVGQASSLSKSEQPGYFTPFLPLDITTRHLPHWEQENVTYFVTFRLADSLPKPKLERWKREREQWLNTHDQPYSEKEQEEYSQLFSERINDWLDAGSGSCLLSEKDNADIVEAALQHFDAKRYKLGSYVIMANHVHVLVSPNAGNELVEILHSWKSFAANELNKRTGNAGAVWQDESYDHIVRSPEQLAFYTNYIQKNIEQSRGAARAWMDRLEACPTLLNHRTTVDRPKDCPTLGDPIDLIIVGRGGGSLEDLWAFNEEIVARAIAESDIPIISAVGHEIDFTIADFVADLRAPTPSAAAELAVPVQSELEEQIVRLAARLGGSLQNRALVLRERIPSFRQAMTHALRGGVQQRQQRMDEAALKLSHQLQTSVATRKQDLKRLKAQLQAYSPLGVLDRGYSLTETENGEVVRDAKTLKKGDMLKTRFAKGSVTSEIISKK